MIYYDVTYAIPHSKCYIQSEKRDSRVIKYLYMYTAFFRNAKGQSRNKSVMVGRVSDGDPALFHPNDKYFEISGTAIPKVILDKKQEREAKKPRRQSQTVSACKATVVNDAVIKGSFFVLKQVFENTGLSECVKAIFSTKESDCFTALSCLMASADTSMGDIEATLRSYVFDTADLNSLSQSTILDLFAQCTQESIDGFFKLWLKRHKDLNEAICYDLRALRAPVKGIEQPQYKGNTDKEDESSLNLALFSSLKGSRPLYYRTYKGSLNDQTQLPYAISESRSLGLNTCNIYICDKGSFSHNGAAFLDNMGFKIITDLCLGRYGHIDQIIEALSDSLRYRLPKYELASYPGIYAQSVEHTLDGVKGVLHIYHDMHQCYEDNKRLGMDVAEENTRIKALQESAMPLTQRQAMLVCRFHYCVKDKSSSCGYVFTEAEDKIIKAQKLLGFFAVFTSNNNLSSTDVLEAYKHQDVLSQIFDRVKCIEDGLVFKTDSSNPSRAMLFVIFMALVVRSSIQEAINRIRVEFDESFIKMTYATLLKELDDISIKCSSSGLTLKKALTDRQKIILSSLNCSLTELNFDKK